MNRFIQKTAICFLSFVMATGIFQATGEKSYAAATPNVQVHSINDIRQYIANHSGTDRQTTIYAEEPLLTAPYGAGRLSNETLQEALDVMNQIRYIAGLDEVGLDEEYTQKAQAGCLADAAIGQLTHYPSQAPGMSDELYELGASGAGSSNIAWTSWKESLRYMIVNMWMDDGDRTNIDRLGHRRWILNPFMAKTGFGLVQASGSYGALYAFDRGNRNATYNNVVWPAQNMPVNYFNREYPWSVSTGKAENFDTVKVVLTRYSDQKSWTFDKNQGTFYVNNSGYGQSGCIIFRPENIEAYQAGDRFHVEITGLKDGTLAYDVNFFNVNSTVGDDKLVDIAAPTKILNVEIAGLSVSGSRISATVQASTNKAAVLEYSWYAMKDNNNAWILLKDWSQDAALNCDINEWGEYVICAKARVVNDNATEKSTVAGTEVHPYIKGKCQMPYTGEGGGYLIGVETYNNPNQSYTYEMLILDCTLLAQGKDAWIYSTGRCGVAQGNALWTIWQPQYGYYWTLFRVYDANGNMLDQECYGFVNAY